MPTQKKPELRKLQKIPQELLEQCIDALGDTVSRQL